MPDSSPGSPDDSGPLSTTIEDGVAVLRFDDGKANVLSYPAIDAFEAALDRAEAEARAVCIVGREGRLCAGFDLSVMTGAPDDARQLVSRGAELLLRLYVHPQPVVVAVTGHALAAGALLVLACDVRIGADVPAKIGLNETSIGMPLPLFATELARDRLSPTAFVRATLAAEIYDPEGAVQAGYLDRVVPVDEVVGVAIAEANRLSAYRAGAYARSKEVLRRATVDRIQAGTAADLALFTVEAPT
ncbi:MAG TPA: crotonase/enoyl-CoA hydratase family protein [Acidimicrobiales bacterium]|jgi:enoyl-CoA hydratase/carnithine racemase|nr:crotonase/enoyl-CoA hydratase family protein [Acidimicrobiales bacterium]